MLLEKWWKISARLSRLLTTSPLNATAPLRERAALTLFVLSAPGGAHTLPHSYYSPLFYTKSPMEFFCPDSGPHFCQDFCSQRNSTKKWVNRTYEIIWHIKSPAQVRREGVAVKTLMAGLRNQRRESNISALMPRNTSKWPHILLNHTSFLNINFFFEGQASSVHCQNEKSQPFPFEGAYFHSWNLHNEVWLSWFRHS